MAVVSAFLPPTAGEKPSIERCPLLSPAAIKHKKAGCPIFELLPVK